jgi:hypothetical protein
MRQETIVKTYLKFEELNDDQKEQAIDGNFSDGWHYDHCLQERIDTLKALAKELSGGLDYSISCVPDRGEFIKIDHDLEEEELKSIINGLASKDCPLTGVCYDYDILEAIVKNDYNLSDAFFDYIVDIHNEYEAMTSVEYISELCEINDYEFDQDTLKLS